MKQYRPHLFVLCILVAVTMIGLHVSLQNALTAARFSWAPRQASGNVVLIAIDSPSLARVGVWPWPRALYAKLIDILERNEVTDIAFDIDFSSKSNPADDRAFAEALREAGGSVVLPAFKQVVTGPEDQRIIHFTQPLSELREHAWIAAANVQPDRDGVLRQYNISEIFKGTSLPSLAALLAGQYGRSANSFLIDFGIRPQSIPTVSYADVLDGDPAALRKLRGKKVIIGGTALELGDRVNIPNGQIVSGVLLQATAAESILQGRALHQTGLGLTVSGLALLFLLMLALWRINVGVRVVILTLVAAGVELCATLLQAKLPVVANTSLFHVAIFSYVVATALDEIDLRGLLGKIADRRFHRFAMSVGDGMICINRHGNITFWNPGAASIFGYDADEAIGRPFESVLSAQENNKEKWSLAQLSDEPAGSLGGARELRGRRKNGDAFDIEACFSAWQGPDGIQYGAVLRDVSARNQEAERIRYLAQHDTLTGLANRNTLYEYLDAKFLGANADEQFALLMLDLDKFKEINDTLGHASGDQVLCAVAERLRGVAPEHALVARLGGDEFAVVIGGNDAASDADELAGKITGMFERELFSAAARQLHLGCSIGVALFPSDAADRQQLLANADLAMFKAKSFRRGKHVFFHSDIRDELEHRLSLTSQLGLAADRNEFELFYQPQVSLRDGKLVGAEALIRWRHPERGILPPAEFLAIANAAPIADKLANWVVKSACMQGAIWQQNGHPLRIGVNLSPIQFKSDDLPRILTGILHETRFSPSLLELEVTESILLSDDEKAQEIFRRIRNLGICIALDDFGTGYASLNYLKKFPLNRLKIDQYFVRDLRPSTSDAAIVDYTIKLSKLLGLSVIAEGIENPFSLDLLRAMNCEEGQGYFFGRPMPVELFEQTFFAEGGRAKFNLTRADAA